MMRLRKLGNSDLDIPVIGQGTMGIGGRFAADTANDQEAIRSLRLGIDLGMSLIDTAEAYGDGHCEELVGRAIRGVRDQVVVATKFSPEHARPDSVVRAVEGSLRRLSTDRIDLYQTHWPNPRVSIEETLRALERLVADGKIRFIGLSNTSPRELRTALSVLGKSRLVSIQEEYNLLNRTVEDRLLPLCDEYGLTLIGYSPLLQGRAAQLGRDSGSVLVKLATKYALTVGQLLLNWVVREAGSVAIPKAAAEAHVRENAAALQEAVSPADLQRITEACLAQVQQIPAHRITVAEASDRNVYRTVEEALQNGFGFVPSPREIAEEIVSGDLVRPIKLRVASQGSGPHYILVEGRNRYWAWVIARGAQARIPALIDDFDGSPESRVQ